MNWLFKRSMGRSHWKMAFISLMLSSPVIAKDITGDLDSSNGSSKWQLRNSATTNLLSVLSNGNVGISSATPVGLFQVGNGTMTILSSGNIGMGTTNPQAVLEIQKNQNSGTYIRTSNSNNNGSALNGLYADTTAGVGIFGLGGPSYTGVLQLQDRAFIYANTSTSGIAIHNEGAQPILFDISNTEYMRVHSDGNVGISTGTPLEKLHVQGNVRFSGALMPAGSAGSNGQLLQSAGTGSPPTWVSTSSFSGNFILNQNSLQSGATFYVSSGSIDGQTLLARTSGNVGIGNTNPQALLSFGTSLANTKLALWEDGANFFGFGIQSNEFRMHVAAASTDFRFYDAPAGSPLMTIKGTGNVGIGSIAPAQKLDVQGGNARFGSLFEIHPDNASSASMPYIRGATNHLVIAPSQNRSAGADASTMYLAYPGDLAAGDTVDTQIQSTIYISATGSTGNGNVGVGATTANAKLETAIASGGLPLSSGSTQTYGVIRARTGNGVLDMGVHTSGNAWLQNADQTNLAVNYNLLLQPNGGNVGIGTATPTAKLEIGNHFNGTAHSTTFLSNSGALGTTAGNSLKLASIGFTSTNESSLGIQALRTSAGSDWTTTAIGLKMDVDNTSPVNSGEIWMTAGGNVGIGTSTAGEKLEVSGNIKLTGGAATYRIRNVADPGLPQDVATKAYVDAAVTAGNPSSWTCTLRSQAGTTTATVSCSGNEKVITGGCYFLATNGASRESRPTNQGWYCDDGTGSNITAYANCCQ